MNTCQGTRKQSTLTTFRITSFQKAAKGGSQYRVTVDRRTKLPKTFCPNHLVGVSYVACVSYATCLACALPRGQPSAARTPQSPLPHSYLLNRIGLASVAARRCPIPLGRK